MLLTTFFGWWYGEGWMTLARKVAGRVTGTLGFFSVGQLATSLFAPFRQISAGKVRGPLAVQFRAWGDRMFSRVIGAVVRTLLILTGLLTAALLSIWGLVLMIAWPVLPALPLVGIFLMAARL
jgi:hypothetical protein